MRVTKTIDATFDEIEEAKQSAIALVGETPQTNIVDLFYSEKLEEVEAGLRSLNAFSSKAWLLSAIVLYTLIYNEELYTQSGLDWQSYSQQSRERLGIENREITEQLSAARFFIRNHKALEKKGFNVDGNTRKLARAELAEQLCGSTAETINHLINDMWIEFNAWYSSFKTKKKLLENKNGKKREDVRIDSGRFYIGDVEAVSISDKISEADSLRINKYIKTIFEIIADGCEPAIVSTYDKKEAALMPKLRDKFRRGK